MSKAMTLDYSPLTHINPLTPKGPRVLLRSPISKKIIIKYNLEEYFGINVQIKVIDLEFFILSIQLDSPMLSLMVYYTI
jgi:hypothetical protein